jgi:hypothetical protein
LKGLADRLVGDGGDHLQLHQFVRQQPQRPARAAVRRGGAGERDEAGFRGPVQQRRPGGGLLLASERGFEAVLDEPSAEAFDGGGADVKGVSDLLILPGRAALPERARAFNSERSSWVSVTIYFFTAESSRTPPSYSPSVSHQGGLDALVARV